MSYTSYAYDPSGQRVDVSIKDGQTYTADGNRIGEGYTVQTNGGIYKMEGGKGVLVDSHNQAVQQPQQPFQATSNYAPVQMINAPINPSGLTQDKLNQMGADVQNFYKTSSQDYFDAQKANFEKQLATQIAELEKSYADAIASGQISIRDAEAQFEAQKKQIEADAYTQYEATKAYGSELGMTNSQQMLGFQQNDNARVNKMNNANATDRDRRINDIKDRLNAITLQKNLSIADAHNQFGYNIAGAQSQASQMYNQSMGGFTEGQYMSNLQQMQDLEKMYANYGYDVNKMGINHGYDLDKMNVGHQYDLNKMGVGHQYDLDRMNKEQGFAIDRMGLQQKYNLESMSQEQIYALDRMDKDAQLKAEQAIQKMGIDMELMKYGSQLNIQEMITKSGLDKSLASHSSSLRMQEMTAALQAEVDEYYIARDRELKRLGITPDMVQNQYGGNAELAIETVSGDKKMTAIKQELDMKIQYGLKETFQTAFASQEFENAFGQALPDPVVPNKNDYYSYSNFTGMETFNDSKYNKDMSAYETSRAEKEKQLEAQRLFLERYGIQ